MARAVWNGAVIAEAGAYEKLEGNVYFPPDAIQWAHFRPSTKTTVCPWKGVARYYDVVVGDAINAQAAWFYPEPKPAARRIANHVAFWNGVVVEE